MKKLRDIMTENVECCSLLDNMYEVALKMKELNVGSIPVIDAERIVGMITDRDIVIRGVAEKNPGSTKVEKVMSDQLITAHADMPIKEALQLMSQHQIRRLPIVEEGKKLIGIVSLGDFAVNESSDEQAGDVLTDISQPSQQPYM